MWRSLAALVLNMTCYSGFSLQTEPWFSPNDRCGSTTTRLRRFRLPPSSRERTLVCFIVSTYGKYERAGWYLRAHLLGRYPHGGAPASRRKGGQDRRNDEVRTRASFCLLPSLVTEENAPWAPEDFGRGKTPDWSGTRVTCNPATQQAEMGGGTSPVATRRKHGR